MATLDGFPASFYGEPGVLGILANGISAFIVLLQNFNTAHTGKAPVGVENILAGVHLILIGGLSQLVAGLLSFRKYDHLSATSFIGYAALWGSYGATRIYFGALDDTPSAAMNNLSTDIISNTSSNATTEIPVCYLCLSVSESAIAGLVPYILLSFLLAFCSATVNYIMPFVFGAITATLVFEAVALVASDWARVVSGVLELLILICAIYGSAALLVKGLTQRLVLKGFGTPLFNVLLLGTTNSTNAQSIGQEKKKNTKYAEPMALGFFCDTIASFIFAFYSFGYMKSFGLGSAWVSIIIAAQLLSSYYALLRQDCYYTTKFGLHATYWLIKTWDEFVLSALVVEDVRVASGREAMVGDWFFVAAGLVLCVGSLNTDVLELIHNMLFVLLTVATIPQIPLHGYYIFFGIACSLFTAVSLYGTFTRLINTIAEKSLIPVGPQPISTDQLKTALSCNRTKEGDQELPQTDRASDALFYLSNGVAALSALHTSLSNTNPAFLHLTVPWVLIAGAIIQAYVSRLQVMEGGRFGSVISSIYVVVWATWTWFRFAGDLLQFSTDATYAFTAGAIAFLVINFFLILIAAYRNLVLLCLTVVMEVVLVCFLLSTLQRLPYQLEICHIHENFPSSVKQDSAPELPCPVANSRVTSGLMKIAKLLEEGGVCGVPTDTVYALAASCKNPQAIEKIYNIKDRPAEKPICICISNVEQLVAAKPPFSPLLWEFMRNVYPGGISCIVSKGDWLFRLGVGPAYDRVGTKESIMIRVPDHTVTGHLCDITGPLAITSANPSGEPDSTHHTMVINRLGHKIQGVLCDGDSNEVVASTVVNCLKIDEGIITIVREGCVPAVKVRQIFDRVKSTMV
ncbi:YrdC domain-containing protein, mitochondrial [Collichthys lucidus]|uniref:Threonylcarbamoyl-AMP synthase n=1 Tax=Collichthys lucidus TaxID=240159 RepID=A0A4U5UEJ5_COLLU|nr:YrdC domain-containing protein, mitochondrial [Collichthys lucidus]